ncbi:MAG TPA: pyruvate formate lyase family protein, partial [Desulfobacter postgatei]|nr:pyruvate formate lyase family protein [Desulfobacter postgatei]
MAEFAHRYSVLADKMAEAETDPDRTSELYEIANICRTVPINGAGSFREAVQSMMFGQLALFQESMGPTVCPGRLDQIFFPYYQKDLEAGRITREEGN